MSICKRLSFCFSLLFLLFQSCNISFYNPFSEILINLKPVPGSSGTITASFVEMTSMMLSWNKATDDNTSQASLEYRVYRSLYNDIDTVSNAVANGILLQDWTYDNDIFVDTTLAVDTVYYFNVIVRDDQGMENAYTMMSEKTLMDMDSYEAFWNFNDGTDSSGNGHNLNNFGATPAQNRALTDARAYSYSSSYMETATQTELNSFTTELTVSAWIYITGDPAVYQIALCKYNAFGGYYIGVNNNHVYAMVNTFDGVDGQSYSYYDGGVTLASGQWYHVVMTFKVGGNLSTYVNNVWDQSVPITTAYPIGPVNDQPFTVGAPSWNRSVYLFDGVIDDVRIYGRELNANEILYLYNLPPD